jgi:hypothetical protein
VLSNAINTDRVLAAMRGRLGWRQPTRGGVPTLTTANTTATSGRYYGEGFHEAAGISRLYEVQEDKEISESEFNTLLQQWDDEVIMRCINAVFNRPQLIDNCLIYERGYPENRAIPLTNTGRFVGYQITVAPGDYSAYALSASLYFDEAATFNLYLFNDMKASPLQTKSVTTVANDQTLVTLDWQITNLSASNKGGTFYIGYFQDDISPAKALDDTYQCATDTKIFGAVAIEATQTGAADFDRTQPVQTQHSYGLNLQIASCRDYTETIVRNAHLFDEVRGLVMALRVLGTAVNSLRSNNTEMKTADQVGQLLADMNTAFPTQEMPYVAGLKSQITRELKRINANFFPKATLTSAIVDCLNDC